MHKYRAIAVVELGEGAVVELTEAQLKRRRHRVAEAEDRLGYVVGEDGLQFKPGEEFACDGRLNPSVAESLDPLTDKQIKRKERAEGVRPILSRSPAKKKTVAKKKAAAKAVKTKTPSAPGLDEEF